MTSKYKVGVFFISGAGLGAPIWEKVAPALDLPYAVADHSAARRAQASLQGYVDADEEQIMAMPVSRVVIVAHSIGGVVGGELLKRLGTRVAGFVAISAMAPSPGQSFLSTLPFPQSLLMRMAMKLAGTKPPEAMIRKGLCSGLTTAQADEIVRDFVAESAALYTDCSSSTSIPSVKTLYIQTTQDKQLGAAQQAKMARRLRSCALVSIASDHLPMISHSTEVIAALKTFVNEL